MMVEFYCGVCSGYCLDVLTHFSQYYNSSQFTVILYTIHSTNHTIQYYYGVFLYFLFFEKIEIKKVKESHEIG